MEMYNITSDKMQQKDSNLNWVKPLNITNSFTEIYDIQ